MTDHRSARLFEDVLAEFLQAQEKGEHPDRNEYIARYPELATELQEFFAKQDWLQRLAPQPTAVNMVSPEVIPHFHAGEQLSDTARFTEVGSRFGDYQLQAELGRGGMGIVYKAWQFRAERPVALKVIRTDKLEELTEKEREQWLARFRAEVMAVAAMDDPGIISLYDVGEHEGQPYFSMKLVQGQNLSAWSRDMHARNDTLLPAKVQRQIATMLSKTARAVHHAHQRGILHRDLKPANILLDTSDQLLVTDFGLAKRLDQQGSIVPSGIVGSTPYIAPEQINPPKGYITTAVDIYGIGAILYEMLTDQPPFKGDETFDTLMQVMERDPKPPRDIKAGVDRDLETICLKCLQKEPGQRYHSALELADDLENWLNERPIKARPAGPLERAWRWCRRNSAVASLAAIVLLLVISIAVLATVAAIQLRVERDSLRQTNDELKKANEDLSKAKERAENAESEKTQQLWKALLHEARARRWSGRVGQQFAALKALRQAAEIKPSLELRNEAIACMALPDVRVDKQWDCKAPLAGRIAFDAEYKRYALPDAHGGIVVRRVADDREILRLRSDTKRVHLRFSPNGRFLAVAARHLRLWDLTTQHLVLDLRNCIHGGAMDFSPDSQRLALGQADAIIRVYDLNLRKSIRTLRATDKPSAVCFGPQGRTLAGSSVFSSKVQVWDLVSGKVIRNFHHQGGVRGIAWHPDGRLLATACADRCIYLWDISKKADSVRRLEGSEGIVVKVAFNNSGRFLFSFGWDGCGRLWDVQCGKELLKAPGVDYTNHVHFSTDDRLLGFHVGDRRFGIWEISFGEHFQLPYNPPSGGGTVAIGSGSRLLASAGDDGVRLWDVKFAKEIAYLPNGVTRAAVFDPSEGDLITSGPSGVWRWPINSDFSRHGSQAVVGPRSKLGPAKGRVCVSLDGKSLMVHYLRDRAVVLNLDRSGHRVVLGKHGNLSYLALSPSGRWCATGTWHGQLVKIWNAQTGKLVRNLPGGTVGVQFSPDGKWLVTSTGREYRFWEAGSWRPRHYVKRKLGTVPGPMAFTRDGKMMAIAHSRRIVQLVDPATGRAFATLESPDPKNLACLCFSPDGSYLAAASGKQIQLWNLRSIRKRLADMKVDWDHPSLAPAQKPAPVKPMQVQVNLGIPDVAADQALYRFKGHKHTVFALTFSPNGRWAYSGAGDWTIRKWDLATGEEVQWFLGHEARVLSLAVSPDGRHLVSGGDDRTIRIWDATTGKELRQFDGVTRAAWGIAISSDGRYILAGSEAQGWRIWELNKGKMVGHVKRHWANAVTFSRDGRKFLAGGRGGNVTLWDVQTKKMLQQFQGHKSWMRSVAISENGRYAFSASGDVQILDTPNSNDDYTIRVWDIKTGKEIHCFRGHKHTVFGLAPCHDNRHLLSGSADGTIRLLDTATGKEVWSAAAATPIMSVAVSPDGRYALSGGLDGVIQLWRLPSLQPANKLSRSVK